MASDLLKKQAKFAGMLADLIRYAESLGYHVTMGDVYRPDGQGHRMGSNHYIRLAADLNLFDCNWNYRTETSDHTALGIYWEAMGGTWGGRFDDGNHYSLEHEGMK